MRKVAIVGGSPSSQFLAPFDNPEWEIWVHGNQLERHLDHRVSMAFEIHDDLTEHGDPLEYAEWLIKWGIPLVVGDKFPLKEAHTVFPDECDVLGMLTSTPAYMMAYAIYMKATDIAIYGVDMAVDDHEYFKQRPAMYAWIAYAKGLGINVTIAEESPLFVEKYKEGRDWGKESNSVFSEKEFLSMVAHHEAKMDEYKQLYQNHDGCKQVYTRLAKVSRAVESGQEIKHLTDSLVIKE